MHIFPNGSGISVIDVFDATAPEEVGFLNWTRPSYFSAGNLAVGIDHVYVAAYTGLWVIYTSFPENPFEVTFFPTGGWAQEVAVAEEIAYVADGYAGLWIVDVADPGQPQNLSHLPTDGFLYNIAVIGDYAYLLHYPVPGVCTGSLWIADVSDPLDPTEISQLNISGNALALSGDQAFVTVRDSGLVIVDVSDPANPYRAGFCSISGQAEDVAVWGDYAYVGTLSDGLRIIDVSDPSDPEEVSSYFGSSVASLAVAENFVYVPYVGKLRILDVSNPPQPCVIGTTTALFYKYPADITVSGDYAYMSLSDGLEIIDVSSPENPVVAGHWGWGSGFGVTVLDERIYWAAGGFVILRNDLIASVYGQSDQNVPVGFVLSQNYPNPFNSETMIEYQVSVTRPTRTQVKIYNILGEKVKTLVDSPLDSGFYQVSWDGRDRFGAAVGSGVYFCKLQVGDYRQVRKLLLIR